MLFFFFSSRRRHTRFDCDWSSDVCSSDLAGSAAGTVLLRVYHADPYLPEEERRSEEHTSELQSQSNLVCRLLLEKKKKKQTEIKSRNIEHDTSRIGISLKMSV